MQQLAIVLGIFVALLVDYVLAHVAGGSGKTLALGLEAWRWMFLAMLVPAVIYGLLTLTIPESPRYLISQQRVEDARKVLRHVLGDDVDLETKVRHIQATLRTQRSPKLADVRGSAL